MMSSAELSCVFCKELFDNKDDLQIHFRKHGDPKFSECSTSTDKNNDNIELVKCDVCMEEFPTISKAITHKHKVHPDHDTKYFCSWCGKLFTMKHLYNKHVQSTHASEGNTTNKFHCDGCDVDFFLATAMIYHNKFFHRQDTLAELGHSKKVKKYETEILSIYYCPFCGEENLNKVNLHKHINDDHIDENQSPEEILRCPLCEAIFFHLDAYEVHLTYHSTEDMYSQENEILKQIVDFSLDAVPPLLEQVEDDVEQAVDTDSAAPIDFANFLQQAFSETNDNDDSSNSEIVGKKSKKHKKHKKSKKEKTITLDEFLNMNQDVFGEGLDFQGIEEVPTQVVKKQLKKPAPNKLRMNPKLAQSSELEKLKKQGIVVKLKSNKNSLGNLKLQGTKVTTKIPTQINTINQMKTEQKKDTASSSQELLSKLLNQGNSQLKIVKKTSQEQSKSSSENQPSNNTTKEEPDAETENGMDTEDSESNLKKNLENETDNDNKKVQDSCNDAEMADSDTSKLDSVNRNQSEENNSKTENGENYDVSNDNHDISDDDEIAHKNHSDTLQKCSNQPATMSPAILNPLKNISSQITVKSTSSKKDSDGKITCRNEKIQVEKNFDSDEDFSNEITKNFPSQNSSKKSIDTLKALSHLTVKPVNLKVKLENPTIDTEMKCEKNIIATSAQAEPDKNHDEHDAHLSESKVDSKPNAMALVLKNLSKHITVKSPQVSDVANPATDNNSSEEDHAYCSDEDNIDDDEPISKNTQTENPTLQSNKPLQIEEKKPDILNRLTNITAKSVPTKVQTKNIETNTNLPSTVKDNINQSNTILHVEEKTPIDVLNRLSNITTKPLFAKPQIKKPDNKHVNLSTKTASVNANKEINDEIEIFNIDDSDDEDLNARMSNNKNDETIPKDNIETTNSKSANILKNICKSVTVKSANSKNDTVVDINKSLNKVVGKEVSSTVSRIENKQQQLLKLNTTQKMHDDLPNEAEDDFEDEDDSFNSTQESNLQTNTKADVNDCSKNNSMTVLQKLSKNITIKSNTLNENVGSKIINRIDNPETAPDKNNSRFQNAEVRSMKNQNVVVKRNINKPVSNKSLDVFKNLSKNITIKSAKSQDDGLDDSDHDLHEFDNDGDTTNNKITSNFQQSTKQIEQFKSLGKDIVIKTKSTKLIENKCQSYIDRPDNNISSSNPGFQSNMKKIYKNMTEESQPSFSKQLKNRKLLEGFDSDSDSSTKGTKITELEDDEVNSDDDHNDKLNYESPPNMSVESPHSHDETFEEFDDIESQLQVSKVKNPRLENEPNLSPSQKPTLPNLNNTALSIKPYKPTQNETSNKIIKQATTKNFSQSNKNQCSTSTDTVSKEVNVKTFQSKTVIEEITTTVTKTIRTVNQTVQQEVRQTTQSNQGFKTPMRPLKVQGMFVSNQRIKNFEGVTVRQAVPTGPRIRNPTVLNRPVRPSNQIVPMRPNVNTRLTRPAAVSPRMPNIRPNQAAVSRPLKISPNVLVAASKPKEEPKGHFSCFKKPIESLIPVPDVCSTSLANTSQGESSVHYSAKQVNRTSFNSTTKVVKGNSTATSVQSTSQMCATSEQISKLSNMSGLKVVKTSQSKQVMQVQEQREGNATKRTTLEAIEKLQKQGLLVKKPRLDDDDDHFSEHSNSDAENDN